MNLPVIKCYTSKFHLLHCSAVSRAESRAQALGGAAKQRKGLNKTEHRTATTEPSAFLIAHHRGLLPIIIPPPHFHTRIPRQQRSRGVPDQPLRGAAHLKGLRLRDGDLENFCRAFSWHITPASCNVPKCHA